jgi:hypothetical protein
MRKIHRKLDELKCFMEDAFITPEEIELLKEAGRSQSRRQNQQCT